MNRETRLGVYIVCGIVLLLGFLVCGAFLFVIKEIPYVRAIEHTKRRMAAVSFAEERTRRETANVNLYADGPFKKDYAVAAVLELPPVPPQRDAPSVQLGFYEPHGAGIQGGIIRAPEYNFQLRAFVSYADSGWPDNLMYLQPLTDGPHHVELRARGDSFEFSVDGQRPILLPRFRSMRDPWLFLGTSVTHPGSTASGTIADIEVQRDGQSALTPDRVTCVGSNGGIHLVKDGTRWVLGGTNALGVPLAYEHCAAVFARRKRRINAE